MIPSDIIFTKISEPGLTLYREGGNLMTKDESIALAEKLGKEYMSLTQMQAKISDYEDRLSKPVDDSRKHANVFDFFSKCLGGSIITAFILAIPGYFWAGMANYIAKSNGTYTHDHLIDVIALIVIIFALIHLIGGFVARKRLKDFNPRRIQNLRQHA